MTIFYYRRKKIPVTFRYLIAFSDSNFSKRLNFHRRINTEDFQYGLFFVLSGRAKLSTTNNAIRPVLRIPRDYLEDLSQKFSKRYHLISHNASESPETRTLNQQAASSSSTASEPLYGNKPRFVMTDTTLKRENVFASIYKNLNTATTTAWLTWRLRFNIIIEITKTKTCLVLKNLL